MPQRHLGIFRPRCGNSASLFDALSSLVDVLNLCLDWFKDRNEVLFQRLQEGAMVAICAQDFTQLGDVSVVANDDWPETAILVTNLVIQFRVGSAARGAHTSSNQR